MSKNYKFSLFIESVFKLKFLLINTKLRLLLIFNIQLKLHLLFIYKQNR